MSDSEEKDNPAKPFSAFAYEAHHDAGTLSLSDSEPELSDDAEVASVSPGDEEDDEEHTGQDGGHKPSVLPFTLKGTDAGFSLRSRDIFGGLQGLQKSSPLAHHSIKGKREEAASSLKEDPRENSNSDSAEEGSTESEVVPSKTARVVSTSAKPSAPAGRLPDYLAHPERWTKYSLEDVPEASDRTNRSTALTFLTELKQQKEAKVVPKEASLLSYNQDSSSSGESRILFTKRQKESQESKDKSGLHLGPLHMTESWGEEGREEGDVPGERAKTEALGFHGFKKRSRKNIRPKANKAGEEDEES